MGLGAAARNVPNLVDLATGEPGESSNGGYHDDGFDAPQDTIVTADNSVWTANMQGNTVSQVVSGDPDAIRTWGGPSCPPESRFRAPWGLASDADGTVFVTNATGRSVSVIDPTTGPGALCPTATYPLDANALPQGIATDSEGNLWVADTYGEGKVTFLDASDGFAATPFTADGTTVGPWSVAVDGADNVWVADFFGKRIINLCGASGNCPEGMQQLGNRISPAGVPGREELGNGGGYGANGALQAVTAITIDQAGNVWVANNFKDVRECLLGEGFPDPMEGGSTVGEERIQTTCGGNGAVVMFGAAAPVAAPMIGPPRQP